MRSGLQMTPNMPTNIQVQAQKKKFGERSRSMIDAAKPLTPSRLNADLDTHNPIRKLFNTDKHVL